MVTREQLRNFRRSKRELKTILALMRQAELRVSADTTRQRDRERAQAEAARYEKAADALAAEQERIETAIQTLGQAKSAACAVLSVHHGLELCKNCL